MKFLETVMGEQNQHVYEFGPFRLDAHKRLLLRDDKPVKLFPKEFDTLLALVERNGESLDKDELMRRVWGGSIVEEGNLTTYVSHLRKLLGERKGQYRYIVTVPGEGYRFVADVRELRAAGDEAVVRERTRVAFEITEEQEEPAARPGAAARAAGALVWRRRAPLLIGLAAALALGGFFWLKRAGRVAHPAPPAPVRSIAVLPFKPLVAASRDEALEMGMADTLITRLSNIRQLSVRPISAVRRYSELEQDPVAAGREQKVDAVLDGHIQKAGGRVRVTVRLVDVNTGAALWAERFDEKVTDIFSLQDLISERLAAALAVELTGKVRELLAKRYTENPEAYQAYMTGRYFWNKRTEQALKKAVEYFRQAVEKDPVYAPAYVGIADSYIVLRIYSEDFSRDEYHRRAKDAALKALEIDNNLAEAHASLGGIRYAYERDWRGAEEEYKLAIELNPNYATARQWYAEYLQVTGRLEEGLAQYRVALQLDPLSLTINSLMGVGLYHAHRYDQAIEQFHKTLDIDPNFARAHLFLAHTYEMKGMFGEAIAEFQRAEVLEGESPEEAARLGAALRDALASSGERGYWQQKLNWLTAKLQKSYVYEYDIAICHAILGERDQAFARLEQASRQDEEKLYYIKAEPKFDGLRSDPRYTHLLRRIGLEP